MLPILTSHTPHTLPLYSSHSKSAETSEKQHWKEQKHCRHERQLQCNNLGLVTNANALMIDSSALVTYGMSMAGFLLQDKLGKVQFFDEGLFLSSLM